MAALNTCQQAITIDATPQECFATASGFEVLGPFSGTINYENYVTACPRSLSSILSLTVCCSWFFVSVSVVFVSVS